MISRLEANLPKALDTATDRTATFAKQILIRMTPVQTGQTRRGWHKKKLANSIYTVFNTAKTKTGHWIARLLEDSELRKRQGAAGRRRVLEEFDLQQNTRRVLALFHEALGLQPMSPETVRPLEPTSVAPREGSV